MAKYVDYLQKIKKCPFCKLEKKYIVYDSGAAYIKVAKAPYGDNHLLVVPKRHVTSFLKLNSEEYLIINSLCIYGVKLLKKLGHKNVSVLVRDGKKAGKSIEHLHYHLIPNIVVGSLSGNVNERYTMSNKEEECAVKKFKKLN